MAPGEARRNTSAADPQGRHFVVGKEIKELNCSTWTGMRLRRTMLSTIAEIIRDLLIFVGVIAALLIALIIVVSMLPNANPLKRVLTALCYRLGATLAAGAVAILLEPIPGIDLLYDIGVPIVLIWYWYTFFGDARRIRSGRSPSVQKQVTYRA